MPAGIVEPVAAPARKHTIFHVEVPTPPRATRAHEQQLPEPLAHDADADPLLVIDRDNDPASVLDGDGENEAGICPNPGGGTTSPRHPAQRDEGVPHLEAAKRTCVLGVPFEREKEPGQQFGGRSGLAGQRIVGRRRG